MTCEQHGNMIICSRGHRGQRPPSPKAANRQWKQGDRVVASVNSKSLVAVVLQVKQAPWSNGQLCKLRAAAKNPFAEGQWIIQELKDWVSGTLLSERAGPAIPAWMNEDNIDGY